MNFLWDNAEKVGALAGAASAILALIAIVFAAMQISSGRNSAREINALQAYQSYLRSCVERPTFGSWSIFSTKYGYPDPATLMEIEEEETERYYWFVYEMLLACEQILINADSRKWREAVRSQISYHSEFIRLVWDDERYQEQMWASVFSKKLDKIVHAAILG